MLWNQQDAGEAARFFPPRGWAETPGSWGPSNSPAALRTITTVDTSARSRVDATLRSRIVCFWMVWGKERADSLGWRIVFLLIALCVFGFSTQSRLQLPGAPVDGHSGVRVHRRSLNTVTSQRLKVEEASDEQPCLQCVRPPEPLVPVSRSPRAEYDSPAPRISAFLPTRAVRPPPGV